MTAKKHVFVSFRNVDPDRTIAELIAAEASKGHDVFFAPQLAPATDWGAAIQNALDNADVFIVVVSTATLEDGEMVRGEVESVIQRRRQSSSPAILPVRVSEVHLPYPWNAYLNPYQSAKWTGEMDTLRVIDAVRRVLAEETGHVAAPERALVRLERMFSSAARREKMRIAMVERVRHDWIEGVLDRSLYALARIDVRFATLPSPMWRLVSEPVYEGHKGELLPAGIRIQRIFDDHLGQLLILGVPGVGKTTLILELARDLLSWSEDDSSRPIPVVLNLSSWRREYKQFEAWLVDEINRSYDIPRQVAKEWVETEGLIILLDGLDEVASELREAWVDAFNAFRAAHGTTPFVLSSRVAEFIPLSSKLRIRTAVIAQPLQRSDLEVFLDGHGQIQDSVRDALKQDSALWDILDTPLMLSIVAIACQNSKEPSAPAVQLEARRRELFARYVDAALMRRSGALPYDRELIISWLSWLARRMQELGRTVFHVEDLSRDWLQTAADRRVVWFAMTCGVWLAVPLAWNWDWFLRGSLRSDMAPVRAVLLGLTAALLFRPAGTPRPAWNKFRDGVGFAAASCMIAVLTVQQFSSEALFVWGSFSAILSGLSLALFWRPWGPGLEVPTESFAWHWKSALRGAMWAALLGSLFGAAIGLQPDTLSDSQPPLNNPVVSAIFFGVCVASFMSVLIFPFAGWRPTVPDKPATSNARVWRSFRNATLVPLGLTTAASAFALWLDSEHPGDWYNLIFGVSVVWGLLRGGLFCIQHFLVKLILRLRRLAPWRYNGFLDLAAELLILRKVGNGYVFVHRMLLDYFASLEGYESTVGKARPKR